MSSAFSATNTPFQVKAGLVTLAVPAHSSAHFDLSLLTRALSTRPASAVPAFQRLRCGCLSQSNPSYGKTKQTFRREAGPGYGAAPPVPAGLGAYTTECVPAREPAMEPPRPAPYLLAHGVHDSHEARQQLRLPVGSELLLRQIGRAHV